MRLVKVLALSLSLLAVSCGGEQKAEVTSSPIKAIAHQVDVQETFFEASGSRPDGSFAVPGSAQLIEKIEKVARAFHSAKTKAVASIDWHSAHHEKAHMTDDKTKIDVVNGPFPIHGLAGQSGPDGSDRIEEVASVFEFRNQLMIPHNEPKNGKFELAEFDVNSKRLQILNLESEVVIRKNGDQSTDVWSNPRTEQIYEILNPNKNIPIFVYGVVRTICLYDAVKGFLDRGYTHIHVIEDATDTVNPTKMAAQKAELEQKGVEFVTTKEALKEIGAGHAHGHDHGDHDGHDHDDHGHGHGHGHKH